MTSSDDRVAELIAAALAGDLTAEEAVEFERLRRDHPRIDAEMTELGVVTSRLRRGDLAWVTPRDPASLRDRVHRSIADEAGTHVAAPDAGPRRARRSWLTPVLAAACLAVGLVAGLLVPAPTSPEVAGPPGTLGAVEPIVVADGVAGIDVDAELVAHTWGTETILEATGLDVGSTYEIVFVGADGTEYSGGEVLGSEVPIVCRMNAAVLRDDAVRFELRDADSTVVAHAELPEV
jgi:hypothetical protein